MTKYIVTILVLAMVAFVYPQEKCNCDKTLNQLICKIESEYPGLTEKTTDTLMYRDFKERLTEKSKSTSDANCYELLKHYLAFFKDPHIYLMYTGINDDTQANQTENKIQTKVSITLDEFYDHVSQSDDELEGVWKSSYYKVGIIKENNEYLGFIIEASNESWHANEIKFRLVADGKADYYMGDHSLEKDSYELHDGSILSFKNISSTFIRELPKPKLTEDEIELKLDKIEGFYFAKMSDRTSLLCISSFEHPYVERIENMVSDNQQAIEKCENLIIDVRNNLGGTYDAYDEILPIVLTHNIRGVGQEFLVTQTLIDEVEDWFDDEEGKKEARRWISLFEGNIGKFVNTDTSNVYISDIEISKRSPKRIAILVNQRTASSGEAFVLTAKQSKKVKVLGVPTYGAIDYGSASEFDFGCPDYKLMMPTWRSMRLPEFPLDNIGIQPDVYLDKSVEDWVQFAVEYLEN